MCNPDTNKGTCTQCGQDVDPLGVYGLCEDCKHRLEDNKDDYKRESL